MIAAPIETPTTVAVPVAGVRSFNGRRYPEATHQMYNRSAVGDVLGRVNDHSGTLILPEPPQPSERCQ